MNIKLLLRSYLYNCLIESVIKAHLYITATFYDVKRFVMRQIIQFVLQFNLNTLYYNTN